MNTGNKRPRTAADFLAELSADNDFQIAAATRERELQARVSEFRDAERPIVEAVRAAGVPISSVWDLVNTDEPYPIAIPVLVQHLEIGSYPSRVLNSLGRALAVKPAVKYWPQLKSAYLRARDEETRDGLAVALAGAAGTEQTQDLVDLVETPVHGGSRLYFLRPILELGGSRGRNVIEALRDDPTLGQVATELLGKRL